MTKTQFYLLSYVIAFLITFGYIALGYFLNVNGYVTAMIAFMIMFMASIWIPKIYKKLMERRF